jgi:hypothetical protein
MTHPPKGAVKIQDGVREEYINSSLMVLLHSVHLGNFTDTVVSFIRW